MYVCICISMCVPFICVPGWAFVKNVEVHWITAVCENMISAEAMRPGDVLTASNGMVWCGNSLFFFFNQF